MEKKNIKICIVVASLSTGGAERSSAILSRMLAEAGYQVTILCVVDDVVYDYKGRLVNLDVELSGKKGILKKIGKFFFSEKFFNEEKFDFIIDTRSRSNWLKQLVTNKFVFNRTNVIFMVHNYNLKLYFPKNKFLARIIYQKAFQLVGVSKAAVEHFKTTYGFKKGICIYNAYDKERVNILSEAFVDLPKVSYILSYGRIVDEHKDYSFLIRTYAASNLKRSGVYLVILGDGKDKLKIINLVKDLGVTDYVIFKDFSENPFPYVKKAMFTTLTSNYEGFPMVLVESLSLGTPVVAVDCKSGPSEIIVTGKNGILVPFKNELKFIEAMNKMIADENFYKRCKMGTISSVSKFQMNQIVKEWEEILR